MARKEDKSNPPVVPQPAPQAGPTPPEPTAESVLAGWRAEGSRDQETRKNFPGKKTCLRRLGTIQNLAKTDREALVRRGTTEAHFEALARLKQEGGKLVPMPSQRKKAAAKVPATPKPLLSRAKQRLLGTRSVAQDRLGDADPLAIALGVKSQAKNAARAVGDCLSQQRLTILQIDAQGNELPDAAPNRVRLQSAGLDATYVDEMIAPLLAELAPFIRLDAGVDRKSVMAWECTAIAAARYFFLQAKLAIQSSARVAKYRKAQPVSEAGRWAKVKKQRKEKKEQERAAAKAAEEAKAAEP